ncbi:hypothetical protein C8D87_11036 [Lentzea atacamensis]|uniref:Uncharacterized protein n=2 Tax=Lentzea atacamensis TaxID=531938 RepID=A0ABX9E1A0_9PSEU|nr:hypothetical protein C8D87_11036 [Lentzea atacamensis]
MDEIGLAESLAVAGLDYVGLADADVAYVPPTLASFGGIGDTLVVAVKVGPDEPQRVEKLNAAWLQMCLDSEFFDDDRRFLLGVKIEDDEDTEQAATFWWAKVALMESWDLAGAGAASLLGHGFGLPSFVMLSLDGNLVLRASREQDDSSGLSLMRDLHLVPELRSHGEWMAGRHLYPEFTRAAVRRWLDAHQVTS